MEAHAKDKWPLGEIESVNQHQTVQERVERAKHFQKKYKLEIPIFADSFETKNFNEIYAAWPERFFILHQGKIQHIAMPANEFGYDHSRISRYIEMCWDTPYGKDLTRQPLSTCGQQGCEYYCAFTEESYPPLCHYHLKEYYLEKRERERLARENERAQKKN